MSGNPLKLTIKAANQKFSDYVIDSCELDWSVRKLKQHLSDNYPRNPDVQSIRLIYSGKLLQDNVTLKECIRYNSEVKNHIIHLVHSTQNINASSNLNKSKLTPNTSRNESEYDVESELTPNTSSSDSYSTTSESSTSDIESVSASTSTNPSNITNPLSQSTSNINNFNRIQNNIQKNTSKLTEKQQYDQILNGLIQYYESFGVQVQSNPWYSSYLQQLALYNHMYSNYLKSINQSNPNILIQQPTIFNQTLRNESTTNQTTDFQQQLPQQDQAQAQPQPQPQPQPQRRVANNNDLGEREDDWLSTLHNIVSFMVLFSIIYFYSSLERFLVIFAIVIILILYHNGWLSLQRRVVNVNIRNNQPQQQQQPPPPPPHQQENQAQPNLRENETELDEELTENIQQTPAQSQNGPNFFRIMFTFIFTFFTSLIPDRPRGLAN